MNINDANGLREAAMPDALHLCSTDCREPCRDVWYPAFLPAALRVLSYDFGRQRQADAEVGWDWGPEQGAWLRSLADVVADALDASEAAPTAGEEQQVAPDCTCPPDDPNAHDSTCPLWVWTVTRGTRRPATPPADDASEVEGEVEWPLSLAEQLCQHVHPSTFAEQVFGSCDPCKRYTLAVIESDWLADDRAARESAAAKPYRGPGDFWTQAEWAEWSNRLAEMLPEEYDGDAAQEALIERALADLVAAATRARAEVPEPDHHHNALACPYCTDDLDQRLAEARAEGAAKAGERIARAIEAEPLLSKAGFERNRAVRLARSDAAPHTGGGA